MKKIFVLILSLLSVLILCSCTEAEIANANLAKAADYFSCERRITVYNARTDTIILEAEGFMSLSNNENGELVVTFKVGSNEYKKNYIYLNENVLYTVEDITGTHSDPYHYLFTFHTTFPVEVDVRP